MENDKVTFTSGATSSKGHDAPYWLLTWLSVEKTAQRFGAGNEKHENSDTVLANANWLKAFHARDLAFFRNRATHAFDHFKAEMQGLHDSDAGGNWGAVGWFLEVISFVEKFDPDFYAAIVGLQPHPGKREDQCRCSRCDAFLSEHCLIGDTGPAAEPPYTVVEVVDEKTFRCDTCHTTFKTGERHACYPAHSFGGLFFCSKCRLQYVAGELHACGQGLR